MDKELIEDLERRMEFEAARTDPPQDWPALPDLPLGRYTDPGFYEAEVAHVWRRSSLFAGHVSQWDELGCYSVVDLGFATVLVVRGEDGSRDTLLQTSGHRPR